MPPPLPRRSIWTVASLISSRRISLPRKGCRVGLRIVLFEACSAFTHVAACTLALPPIRDTLIEGFSHFVTSMTAPIASGWSGRRVGLAPTGKRRLSRRTPNSDVGYNVGGDVYWTRAAELQTPMPLVSADAHLNVALFSDAGRSWATNASIASKLASLSPSQIANLRTIRAIASQRGPARSGRPDNKLREEIELGHELSGY